MGKVFVIPDVHLKPWMFDKAEEILSRSEYDKIVCLGDLVDDRVKFKIRCHDTDREEINGGTVEIIDHYPGGHVSIDVMSGDTLNKHLSLTDVLDHSVGK